MDPVLNQTKTSRSFWKSSRRSELFNHTQTVSRICRKKKPKTKQQKRNFLANSLRCSFAFYISMKPRQTEP